MTPELSIIFGTRNRPNDVRRLLDSIEDRIPESLSYEVVISDASDEAIEHQEIATAAMWKRLNVIREFPPIGCTNGYNVAFRAARGEFCLWMNDDCVIEARCAETAVRFMRRHPEIGIGAIEYGEPGRAQRANSYLGMVYANFGIIDREFGDSLGWFDEDFPMYGNDNSLSFRTLIAGRGIAVIPGAAIYHFATHDRHRIENNEHKRREKDVERLVEKYTPYLDEMRATYERTGGSSIKAHDQTHRSARKHLVR